MKATSSFTTENIPSIPTESLATEYIDGETPLHHAARFGHLNQIPAHLLTLELLTTKDRSGNTPIHVAAIEGNFDQIPAHVFSPELLAIQNRRGNTPIHEAAACGLLTHIPSHLLTTESLAVQDIDGSIEGRTLLHYIAEKGGFLRKVPHALLTFANLTVPDEYGQTPAQIVVMKAPGTIKKDIKRLPADAQAAFFAALMAA
jgi:ankyrin repeat protein